MRPEALLLGGGVEPFARALEVGAIGEHFHAERDAAAAARRAGSSDVERIVGDLHGFSAIAAADARSAVTRCATKGSRCWCRRPTQRGCVSFDGCCVSCRGFASSVVEIDQPQIAAAAIGVEIGFALHVHHVAPVRRHLRIADARQQVEVGGCQGARRRPRRPRCARRTRPRTRPQCDNQDFMAISSS